MMKRAVRIVLAALLAACASIPITSKAADEPSGDSCIPADQCCRICDAGKACGNSCISRRFNCHKGRGCACNASDVCD